MLIAKPTIRKAVPGDEPGIHESHMRSIREVCIKDHGEDEVMGWGNRPLGNRWVEAIKDGHVWVIEYQGAIHGHGYIRVFSDHGEIKAHIHGLYFTPEVIGKGLGRLLTELMIETARRMKVKTITLDSSLTAHGFYKKIGFKDCGPLQYTEIGGSTVRGFPMMMNLQEL